MAIVMCLESGEGSRKMSDHKIAFVIATKDRPAELKRMLKSIESQSIDLDHIVMAIVIVDGGEKQVKNVAEENASLNIKYIRSLPPSAARQRNVGIQALGPEITLIGFLDDDVVLEYDAIKKMMDFWEEAPADLAGASFNMINHPSIFASWLKFQALPKNLGLYSKQKGRVLSSGFHTVIGFVKKDIDVQWLPTTAAIWRRGIFDNFKFDEWFKGYSYLEDLDFSYRVGKRNKFVVIADAQYYHFYNSGVTGGLYRFGITEIKNRLYFVRKYPELSISKCYLSLFIRMIMNLFLGFSKRNHIYFQRLMGNIVGLIKEIF